MKTICLDYRRRHHATELGVLVLDIDELSHVHRLDPDMVCRVINAIGGMNCGTQLPFVVPILAGTIQGPIEELFHESTYLLLHLPLPLFQDSDAISIAEQIEWRNGNSKLHLLTKFVRDNDLFRRSISDIGGMARCLELFYSLLDDKLAAGDSIPSEDAYRTYSTFRIL